MRWNPKCRWRIGRQRNEEELSQSRQGRDSSCYFMKFIYLLTND